MWTLWLWLYKKVPKSTINLQNAPSREGRSPCETTVLGHEVSSLQFRFASLNSVFVDHSSALQSHVGRILFCLYAHLHWWRYSLSSSWRHRDRRGHGEKLRLCTMKRAKERVLVKVLPDCSRRPQHFGDASAMGQLPGTAVAIKWH